MDQNYSGVEAATPSVRSDRGATILIVEDSPLQSELLRRALEGAGYRVIAAGNGAEGLAMVEAAHPAAVVSDVNMPVMDGYALCHAIRADARLKRTPVILLTMLSDPQDVIRGLNAGADAYVTKPYDIPTLVARIESLLAHPPVQPPPRERRKVEVQLAGETHVVDAHGPRILNLLVSTYENAVQQNRELLATHQMLEDMNQHLEQRVLQQTAALAASERRFRSLLEHASDLVAVIDADGTITYVSPSIRRLGGYEVAEVLGTTYPDYVHPDDRSVAADQFAETVGVPGKLHVFEFRFRRKDGAWLTFESIAGAALDDPAINGIVINSRDITERKRAEEKIAKLNRLYATLSGINMTIVRASSQTELFDRVCEVAVEQGRFYMAWIGTVDRAARRVTPVAQSGLAQEDMVMVQHSVGRIAEGQGQAATAIREQRTMCTNDYSLEGPLTPWQAQVVKRGIRGSATLPLSRGGEVVGLLKLYVRERDFFDSEQLTLIEEMRSDISFALDRFDSEDKRIQAEAAQRAAALYARSLIEASLDPLVTINPAGRITDVNKASEDATGLARDRLVGTDFADYFTEPGKARAGYQGALAHGYVRDYPLTIRHSSGGTLDVLYNATVYRNEAGELQGVFAAARDITERLKGQLALERANRALHTLSACNEALVHAEDESGLLESICRLIVETGGYRMAWVGFPEQDAAKTVRPVAHYGEEAGYLAEVGFSWADVELGRGPTGRAIRNSSIQVNRDFQTNPALAPWRETALKRGYRSSIALPLKSPAGVLGVLTIYAAETDAFNEAEVGLLQELSDDLSFGLESLRTRAERDRNAHEHLHHAEILKKSLEDSIKAIADTVEMRDPYTAGHQRRVGDLAAAIARELGLPEETIHGIKLAATVHDLGKINVPSEILSKPGKLMDIEMMLIKSHSMAGYNIVKDIKFPWPIATVVLQHHERLDGSGYPQGLKGGQILLESRIMAVADVVEAMASHRPYRAALGIDIALQEIERGRGSAYDAAVVDACIRLFGEQRFAFSN